MANSPSTFITDKVLGLYLGSVDLCGLKFVQIRGYLIPKID